MNIKEKLRHLRKVLADSRWWMFYFQRRVLNATIRNAISNFVALRFRPHSLLDGNASLEPLERQAREMQTDGITHFPSLLSVDQTKEIRSYFATKPVQDPYRTSWPPFYPDGAGKHAHAHVAYHSAEDTLKAPHLLALVNRPDILALAEKIIGCKPTIGYLAAWWSYPTSVGAQQAELFHRDVDDWRFFKLFIYLTDVDEANGPHVYVAGSSSSANLRTIRRFQDDEVGANFASEKILTLKKLAGDGFLEDTFGIHKGMPVAQGVRLIFQAVYSMSPLPYGPATPVVAAADIPTVSNVKLDGWVNRVYLSET
jgi:hypothetical protein